MCSSSSTTSTRRTCPLPSVPPGTILRAGDRFQARTLSLPRCSERTPRITADHRVHGYHHAPAGDRARRPD